MGKKNQQEIQLPQVDEEDLEFQVEELNAENQNPTHRDTLSA